ncbi:unnamed protein product, partial [Brassica oleracea]
QTKPDEINSDKAKRRRMKTTAHNGLGWLHSTTTCESEKKSCLPFLSLNQLRFLFVLVPFTAKPSSASTTGAAVRKGSSSAVAYFLEVYKVFAFLNELGNG